LVGLIITLLLFTASNIAADDSGWVWTKELPKPSWWRWDKSYYPEKPVRGGYIQEAFARDVGLQNPNHWPVNNWVALFWMYDNLIKPDGSYKPTIPWLATSWNMKIRPRF
jgi:hypothetical protein